MLTKIVSSFDICTGCRTCMLACTEKKFGGYNPRYALLKIDESDHGLVCDPVVCNQCDNAYCERVCPVDAYYRDDNTNIPKIDHQKCIGCGLCVEHCPRKVIVMKDNKAFKCDLCDGEPACVLKCPTGALQIYQGGEQHG